MEYCDLIYDYGPSPDPSDGLAADEAANLPEPSSDPVALPVIQDEEEDVNGPAPPFEGSGDA
jgi:hypothetical protein